jgi:hypothetical protein
MEICYIITLRKSTHGRVARPPSRGADRPRLAAILLLSNARGRKEVRVRAAPAASRARCALKKRTRVYRFSGSNPAFPAQWLYGLWRALPGERAFLPPSLHGLPRKA